MSRWIAYWGTNPSIYVDARHLRAHYAVLEADLARLIGARTVLDFGCGDALAAPALAKAGARVLLYDATPQVRERLAGRYADAAGITVLDEAAWQALPEGSVDVVLVNSVLQYIAKEDLPPLLARWRSLLRPDGELILCDIIAPDASMVEDVLALLRLALRHGFLLAALRGLLATLMSDYRRLRREAGFSCYSEAEMLALLAAGGFAGERLSANPGTSPHRLAFRGRPR